MRPPFPYDPRRAPFTPRLRRPASRLATVLVAASLGCLGVFELGCSNEKPVPAAPLPPYSGEQAALFSDMFRPELFGIEGAQPPEADALLQDRAQRSDYIAPVRVVTVSRQSNSDFRGYTVVVEPTAAPLRGSIGQSSLALAVADGSPTFAWLEIAGSRWVGTRLLLFLRNYQDGPHFFGTVDIPAVREAADRRPPVAAPSASSSAAPPPSKP